MIHGEGLREKKRRKKIGKDISSKEE